jgi:ABC-2 type transport system permease protein
MKKPMDTRAEKQTEKAAGRPTLFHAGRPADGGRVLRHGTFANILTVAALVLAILAGLIVDAIPTKYTRFDLSENGIYTLSDTTTSILDGLTQDVTIYYLAQTSSEDSVVTELLDRYAQASTHVSWVQKDPAVDPTFASQYDAADASDGSLIVVSGEKSNLIDSADLYPADYTNYYTTGSADYSFDGENCLTTAIYNVTSGDASTACYTTNHGETTLSSTLLSAIQKQNISVSGLNLLSDAIPENCDLLIINCPQKDFSGEGSTTDEAGAVADYLAAGGKVLVLTDAAYETPNLDAVLAEYGLSRTPGLVIEGDNSQRLSDAYARNLNARWTGSLCPLPTLNTAGQSGIADSLDASDYFLLPWAQGIAIADSMPDNVTAEALLTTSSSAYSKVEYSAANNFTITDVAKNKDAGDTDGPFNLAAWAENSSTGAEVVWIGCGMMGDDTIDQVVGGNNSKFLLACAAALTDQSSDTLVDAKALESSTLTLSAAAVRFTGICFVLVLPVALIVAGIIVTVRRRRN